MPMADVFSPRSSTFLIDNLLKPGVDKQCEKTTTNVNFTPLENLTNTSAHFRRASPSVFVHSSSSNSNNNNGAGGGSISNNATNFHPAFRPSQQTTVVMPFPPVQRADDVKTNVTTLSLASSLPPESISYPHTPLESNSPARKRKNRTNFTTRQISELENRYKSQRYLAPHERATLARTLGLTDRQVKTWFQNRRMKEKRQATDSEILTYKGYSPESHSPTVTPTSVQHYYPTPSGSGASQHPPPLPSSLTSLSLPPPPPSASRTPAPAATSSQYSSSVGAPPVTSLPYASSVGAPPAADAQAVSVAPPVSTQRTTVAMTAQVSSAPVFQPLSIAVPSIRYSSGLKQRGPGLLMIDTKRQVYTQ